MPVIVRAVGHFCIHALPWALGFHCILVRMTIGECSSALDATQSPRSMRQKRVIRPSSSILPDANKNGRLLARAFDLWSHERSSGNQVYCPTILYGFYCCAGRWSLLTDARTRRWMSAWVAIINRLQFSIKLERSNYDPPTTGGWFLTFAR